MISAAIGPMPLFLPTRGPGPISLDRLIKSCLLGGR